MKMGLFLATIVLQGICRCFGGGSENMSHVIVDSSDTVRYERANPVFAKAFEFLRRPDLEDLPPGRYPIDGSNEPNGDRPPLRAG